LALIFINFPLQLSFAHEADRLLVQLAEHSRDVKDFMAMTIRDVQNPAPPIFSAWRHQERSHDPVCVLACFGQIVQEGSSSIHQQAVGIAAMAIFR
jgi:hypothetical protein